MARQARLIETKQRRGFPAMAGSTDTVGGRLPLWRAVVFALCGLPMSAVSATLLIYLPPHLATQLGVGLSVVAGVFFTVRLIDIGFDPILGMMMDRTRSRLGRYRPWLLAAAPLFVAGVGMLFFAPPGITAPYMVGWLLALYVGLSILTLAPPAWAAVLARDYNDRSRLYGIMATVSFAGLLATVSIPSFTGQVLKLSDADAVHTLGWFLMGLAPVAIGISVALTPEPAAGGRTLPAFSLNAVARLLKKADLVRLYGAQVAMVLGPGWMSSIFLFFSKDYMHFTVGQASTLLIFYMLAALVGAPTVAWIATRFGKHRAIMAVAVAYSVGLMTVLLPPPGAFWAAVPINVWCGFWGAGFELTLRSMLADVADEVRLEQNEDRLSLIFALSTAASKVASASAIIISFPLLQALGYVPKLGQANSPEAIRGLGLVFVAGPIFFVMAGALFMVGWRLSAARHAEIRAALDARDAEAALGLDTAAAAAVEKLEAGGGAVDAAQLP
jgi:Na+/melibiose symporter-like transporter